MKASYNIHLLFTALLSICVACAIAIQPVGTTVSKLISDYAQHKANEKILQPVLPASKQALSQHVKRALQRGTRDRKSILPHPDERVQSLSRQILGALSGEGCSTDIDCHSSRTCEFIDDAGNTERCSTPSGCFCFPASRNDLFCTCEDRNCMFGDICTDLNGSTLCLSIFSMFPPIDCNGPDALTSVEPSLGPALARGATGESCATDDDCGASRGCFRSSGIDLLACSPGFGCECVPRDLDNLLCSCRDRQCLAGDVCSELGDGTQACLSRVFDVARAQCAN